MFGDDWTGAPTAPAGAAADPAPTGPVEDRRALYLRWRPRRFEDVVGQEHVTRTLRNAVMRGRLSHAYLLTGPRGTGKTSIARILYRAANCPNQRDGDPCNACHVCLAALDGRAMDLVEIDAASNRGIDDMRDLREKVAYRPSDGPYKLYIIDEAHELTGPAWDAFLKTLEEPPPHVLFVLATTDAHKVPATIVSRCQRFDLRRIPYEATREQLARVAEAEGLEVEPAVLERLARAARGGLRDALSLLDQLGAFAGGRVDMQVARAVLGLPAADTVRSLVEALSRRDASATMATLADVAEGQADPRQLVEELVAYLRGALLVRSGAGGALGTEFSPEERAWLAGQAPAWPVGTLLQLIQELAAALARTRDAQQFQTQVELALLGICLAGASAGAAPTEPMAEPSPAPGPPEPDADSRSSVAAPAAAPPSLPAPREEAAPAAVLPSAPPPPGAELQAVLDRWTDVVEQAATRRVGLRTALATARPKRVDDDTLVIQLARFHHKRAVMPENRSAIEAALLQAVGRQYRVRCVPEGEGESDASEPSLFDDPVIRYAAKTFGGEPRLLARDPPA